MDKSLKEYGDRNGQNWVELEKAKNLTVDFRKRISEEVHSDGISLYSTDADLIVFGSLARNECTKGSDIDWTLLVDGQASPNHLNITNYIRSKIDKVELNKPGTTNMFGQITFSHEIIHHIGGQDDTNHNLTRRMLLLLESEKISADLQKNNSGTAYDRVLRGIIQQYVENDSGFKSDTGSQLKVPRFFLNDLIRFWRTMCVDFAYKQREQEGHKWALRNIKLRTSRKLIYLKGLLMCFSCYKNDELKTLDDVKEYLRNCALQKPLDFIYSVLSHERINDSNILQLFNSYNDFLALLNNDQVRTELEKLSMRDVYNNDNFIKARKISQTFQDAIDNIFLLEKSRIQEFTIKYSTF